MEESPKYRILIVEDDASLAKTLADMLRLEGYEVTIARDGGEGLEAVKEAPHIILLDLMLPMLSGFEVLSEIKKGEKTRDIPVFILTNLDSPADRDRASALGAKTYIVKAEVTLPDLLQRIHDALAVTRP